MKETQIKARTGAFLKMLCVKLYTTQSVISQGSSAAFQLHSFPPSRLVTLICLMFKLYDTQTHLDFISFVRAGCAITAFQWINCHAGERPPKDRSGQMTRKLFITWNKSVPPHKSKVRFFLSETVPVVVWVPCRPSYWAAVCPWPPSPWESAASDEPRTGPLQSLGGGGGGGVLSSGVYGYTALLLSLTVLTFSFPHSLWRKKRINYGEEKTKTGWTRWLRSHCSS